MKNEIFARRYPVGAMIGYFVLMAALVAADQGIKLLIQLRFKNADLPLLGDYVRLYYAPNTGAAFSMFEGKMLMLIIATVIMIGACVFLLVTRRLPGRLSSFALVLVSAGGIGNLIDRVFRGYVIDYIYPKFIHFAIFNFADSCVVVGAVLLCVGLLVSEKKAGRGAVGK